MAFIVSRGRGSGSGMSLPVHDAKLFVTHAAPARGLVAHGGGYLWQQLFERLSRTHGTVDLRPSRHRATFNGSAPITFDVLASDLFRFSMPCPSTKWA